MVLDSIQTIVKTVEKLRRVVWLWKETIWMRSLTSMVC
ncbi:hypothetical protein LINGRAHAP2_LOCUS30130 [Linum grandiflorum]